MPLLHASLTTTANDICHSLCVNLIVSNTWCQSSGCLQLREEDVIMQQNRSGKFAFYCVILIPYESNTACCSLLNVWNKIVSSSNNTNKATHLIALLSFFIHLHSLNCTQCYNYIIYDQYNFALLTVLWHIHTLHMSFPHLQNRHTQINNNCKKPNSVQISS